MREGLRDTVRKEREEREEKEMGEGAGGYCEKKTRRLRKHVDWEDGGRTQEEELNHQPLTQRIALGL